MNQQHNCGNCRYFAQHYSKRNTRFDKVFCGHCLNTNYKSVKPKRPFDLCDYWEDMKMQIAEREQAIKEVLKSMTKHLNEIALVLKDDST